MRLRITRDSVCMGDDVDAPHTENRKAPDGSSIAALIEMVWGNRWSQRTKYVPSIAGGRATWVIESDVPLAVAAQEWSRPRLLPASAGGAETLLRKDHGVVLFHLRYLAQVDPEATFEDLSRRTGT